MWKNLSENDIRDFDGGRGNNCFLNLGNNGVDDGGVIENVNGTWEIVKLMNAGHREGILNCGNYLSLIHISEPTRPY